MGLKYNTMECTVDYEMLMESKSIS